MKRLSFVFLSVGGNKKSFCPYRDKSLYFCGTTQIGNRIPTHFLRTIMRTPLITDEVPVDVYSLFWFRAALASPFSKFRYTAFAPASSSLNTFQYLLLLLIGFKFILINLIFLKSFVNGENVFFSGISWVATSQKKA